MHLEMHLQTSFPEVNMKLSRKLIKVGGYWVTVNRFLFYLGKLRKSSMAKRSKQQPYDGASDREVDLKDNLSTEEYQGYLYDCANNEYDQDEW